MSDRYELFSNGNNSAVPNSDWQAYALEEPPPSPPPAHTWGAPPAVWNTLHVNGVRQVRARFPNGNPQDNSGLCFSKVQREGEGCDAYLSARGNPYTRGQQNLPGSKTVASLKNEQVVDVCFYAPQPNPMPPVYRLLLSRNFLRKPEI